MTPLVNITTREELLPRLKQDGKDLTLSVGSKWKYVKALFSNEPTKDKTLKVLVKVSSSQSPIGVIFLERYL